MIDGRGNIGMLVSSLAMEEVISLGKKHGIGIVGARVVASTSGALSYYCEKIAKENLIAFVFAQSSPAIAPFSATKPIFGTNPMAFGIPSNPHPIVFDMSTSAITIGTIYKYKLDGKKLPYNVALDHEGKMTTDPEKALKGSLLAFDDSYKGSGLAMMVEILGGLWNEASFAGENSEGGWGNLFMAFSPDLLSSVRTFKERSQQLISILQHLKTREGEKVRIPGENSFVIKNKIWKREL